MRQFIIIWTRAGVFLTDLQFFFWLYDSNFIFFFYFPGSVQLGTSAAKLQVVGPNSREERLVYAAQGRWINATGSRGVAGVFVRVCVLYRCRCRFWAACIDKHASVSRIFFRFCFCFVWFSLPDWFFPSSQMSFRFVYTVPLSRLSSGRSGLPQTISASLAIL